MKNLVQIGFVLLLVLLLSASPATSNQPDEKNILVSHDFIEVLAKTLTKDTDINIVRAIPANYSPDVQTSYLKKQWSQFSKLAKGSDAVLFASAFWAGDPLYPYGRRANIRIVPIDITRPLDNSRAGIPITAFPTSSKQLHFVWNSPGNGARMSDILASELNKLYPESSETVTKNLDKFKRELFKLRTRYEIAFGELEALEAIAFTTDYLYLTDEFGINMVEFFLTPEHKWTDNDLNQLEQTIKSSGIKSVIGKWQPNTKIEEVITAANAAVTILKPFKIQDSTDSEEQLVSFYDSNLSTLLEALKK